MARIGGKDTKPEMVVRRLLHAAGFRYRLHARDLPGRPDLVFRQRRKAVFVHGCFWHRHPGCPKTSTPKTRGAFWEEKFRQNVQRDEVAIISLREIGYEVLVVWECETGRPSELLDRLTQFLADA